MKVFDFNIHLPLLGQGEVNTVVADEFGQDPQGLIKAVEQYSNDLGKLDGAHFMLFNTELFRYDPDAVKAFVDRAKDIVPNVQYSALVDPRMDDVRTYVDRAHQMGARGVKFHAYHQKLDQSTFDAVLSIARMAEEYRMMVEIDTSYGTTKMYEHDNLKLACLIADHITKVPIILLHSGGARVLEAMLIADEKKNVYLESSFSLGYYHGSSLQRDMAFAYRKIGLDRVIYGSDYPYVQMDASMVTHHQFFDEFHFTSNEIEAIMFDNAERLFA